MTLPASTTLPTSSPGAPTARSALPSLLKSPPASAEPNLSPASAGSPPPGLPAGRAVDDVDDTDVGLCPRVLAGHAHGEVADPVAVEVGFYGALARARQAAQ